MKKYEAILYVPSDTPDAMTMPTRKVAGVPIIVRGIMTLAEAGLTSIILLIAKSQQEKIENSLERYQDKHLPDLRIISYDEPYRVSPDIVRKVSKDIADRCIVINANLLFDKEMIWTVRSTPLESGTTILCSDGAHPLPVMDITPSAWRILEPFTEEQPRSIESCLKRLSEVENPRITQKPHTSNTFLIRRHRDRAVAEKFLTEAIRHATDGPIARHINKRLSLPASLLMAKLWISPHAITAVNIIIGLFSGVFIADGHRYDFILFGAALFQIASIVDGCDGEVAKLTFRCSKFGQYIDSLSDNLSLGSFMVGLIAGYWRHTHSPIAFIAGATMLVSTAVTFFWMIRYLRRNTQSASLVTFDKEYLKKLKDEPRWFLLFIKYGKYTLKKDFFSFAFFIFAVAGILYWWLFIAAFGTMVAAIVLTYLNLQSLVASHRSLVVNNTSDQRLATEVVVFDFDGTIVNSMEKFADIAANVMPKYFPIDTATARRRYIETSGIPFAEQLEEIFPGYQANITCAQEFEKAKLDGYFEEPLFDDVADTIKYLKRRGIKVAVSSNNFQHLVESFIGQTDIEIDMVLGFKENFAKGADHFAYIEKTLGVERDAITFVGDSLKDAERAHNYKVEFIGKAGIFTHNEFTLKFPGIRVISTLSELKQLFP